MEQTTNQYILETLQYLKNTQICKDCSENREKLRETTINTFKNTLENSNSYNNTVISLGYVALIVILSAAYGSIYQNIIKAFGVCLIISILFYFFHELHKNSIDTKVNDEMYKAIVKDSSKCYEALDTWFINLGKEYQNFRKYWCVYYWTSLISGVAAAAFLLIGLIWYHA